MNKINILDNKTINKIAAGEVVERPASVVKELVENSIDALASAITIEIKNGGISFIRVTDNGTGIPKEEIKTAFIRHATSKIKDEEDLDNILSLGFRGEALASIAAVSQVEVITKESEELTGIRLEIEGGIVASNSEVGCPEGTTMIIKNLFFNTPARRKFLKAEVTETSYIDEIVSKISLGHPEIAFNFINNGKIIFNTSGNNDLQNVIFNVYGREISKSLIDVKTFEDNIKLDGFLAKPEISRASRIYENFFVNGRYIKSGFLEEIVEEAYKPYIMQKRFPFCVLKLTIPPDEVDANVHPAKTEVRFKEEEKIKEIVLSALSKILERQILIIDVGLEDKKDDKIIYDKNMVKEAFEVENEYKKLQVTSYQLPVDKKEDENTGAASTEKVKETYEQPDFTKCIDYVKSQLDNESLVKKSKEVFVNYRIVGQVFNTYWIIEQEDKMYMIDQHAAHEKVLYEKLISQFESDSIISQQLLQPIVLELSLKEKEIINKNIEVLRNLGFDIEEFGINSFAIREVPMLLGKPSNSQFFLDIIDEMLANSSSNLYNSLHEEIATIACKAAVKAHDKMSFDESRKLIEDLMKLKNPFNCPHGRPVIIAMDKYEIEKKFKRII